MTHDPNDEAHNQPEKHLQLGVDFDQDDRTPIPDEEKEALWASATTHEAEVEAYQAMEEDRLARDLTPEAYAQEMGG